MKKIFLFLMVLALSLFAEKITYQIDFRCNKVGDAKVIWKQQATAIQWKLLMQRYGNNPALLKKEVISSLPNYQLSNFQFKKDEMNRAFIFSFDAKGIVRYRGNGIWQFEYEKDMTPRKINNHTWLFSNTEADGNFIDEEFITLILPKEIKNAHLSKNEFDDPVLEYYLKPSFIHSFSLVSIVGILLIVVGLILILLYFFGKKDYAHS